MLALMAAVTPKLAGQWTQGDHGRALSAHQWQEQRDASGAWRGEVRLQFASEAEVGAAAATLRGYAVDVGGHVTRLEFSSPFLQEWGASPGFLAPERQMRPG